MKTSEFFRKIEEGAVVEAIRTAESHTTGEIRVFVASHGTIDVVADARRRFRKLRMYRTADRNAVLLYFVPGSQQFAVVGDTGIDQCVGAEFWSSIAAEITGHLRDNSITAALVAAIQKIGHKLAKHFPCSKRDENDNQVPDSIGHE